MLLCLYEYEYVYTCRSFVCMYICVFVFLIVHIKACVSRDQKYVFFGARIADVSARN